MGAEECGNHEQSDSNTPRAWSVERVLSVEPEPIAVDSGCTTEIGPHLSNVFPVVLEKFHDLKLLGIVPRSLEEEVFAKAVSADDAAVFEQVIAHPDPDSDCKCSGAEKPVRESAIRRQYEAVRKSFNPNLAQVMSESARVRLDWDAPLVAVARNRYISLALRPEILLLLARDITINRGATMLVDRRTKVLLAHRIYIHDSGVLATRSGYLRIWANSVSRWNDLTSIAIHPVDRPVWALT